jgi:two-component system NtrC family response regulator
MCAVLSDKLAGMGHQTASTFTLKDGVSAAENGAFDVVLLDVRMPDGNGLDMLPRIQGASSSPEVIIITGLGDPDGAELAITSGAWDYLEKGASLKAMTLPLVRALQYRQEKLASRPRVALNREGIVGSSPPMKDCFDLLAESANSDGNVLISGETGTGKELFAWAIHNNSPRADKSFVVVDCAALPEKLVESLLFGHEKGAFTGADQAKDGLVTQADGGTLYLDEVGEMPLSIQKAFLRVLQEHRFRPVGSQQETTSDFRLVASTNRDLDTMVERGKFRSDLLFRLRAFTLHLPPLRERQGDIKEITIYYVAKLCERYTMETKGISPEFLDAVAAYAWPGNVRELINALERALAAARHVPTLFARHLPTEIRIEKARSAVAKDTTEDTHDYETESHREGLPNLQAFRDTAAAQAEKQYLQDLMASTGGKIKEACRISGLSRSHLYGLLKKHDLSRKK